MYALDLEYSRNVVENLLYALHYPHSSATLVAYKTNNGHTNNEGPQKNAVKGYT